MGRALAGGVVGLAAVAALLASGSTAAASGQAPPVAARPRAATALDPLADITDVYAWMVGSNIELVMDVSPGDDGSHAFGPGVVYAFHVTSKPGNGLGTTAGSETRVIVRFTSTTAVEAWVTDATGATIKDFVAGDPSPQAGIVSTRGKLRLFAGRRSDPRFFNGSGLATGLAVLAGKLTAATKDAASCPTLQSADALTAIAPIVKGGDSFAGKNVMAIVVQIDKALVNVDQNKTVAVWGSTHAGA